MRNIIVIGASAGGMSAINSLLKDLPPSLDAVFFVVIHLSQDSDVGTIAGFFQKNTHLHCEVATDGKIFERGHVYIAQADRHLLIEGARMRVQNGAQENRYRPSIDMLFRSAAVHHGNRVIGIILTGMLEDGTSGMSAVKRCGGTCIVQTPSEAEFLSMPQSVVNVVDVDYQADLAKIPKLIEMLLNIPLPEPVEVPIELEREAEITTRMASGIDDLKTIGNRSDLSCPDCGGRLFLIKNDPAIRYRCHTGHTYTEKLFLDLQRTKLEESVWVSIRMLEERANLMKVRASRPNGEARAMGQKRSLDETENHIDILKQFLDNLGNTDVPN